MDTHIKGPAVNGHGAISGMRGLQTKFGVTLSGAANRRLLLRTQGASITKPILVGLLQVQKTAFDGTAPNVLLISENLDGSGTTTELNIAALVTGQAPKTFLLFADKNYYVQYTLPTGSPTAGEIWSMAWIQGLGPTT